MLSQPTMTVRPATAAGIPPKHRDRPGTCPCETQDHDAFVGWVGRLVHDHRAHLVRVAQREGVTPEDAFDVVQEAFQTFLTLPAARSLVDVPDDSRHLLTALVRNAARNRRRLAAVARPHESDPAVVDALPGPDASVDELLAAAEEQVLLRGCVQSLGDVQRAVVTLRMLDEVDGESVARTLGITPGNVAVLLHRAKTNLQTCMTAARSTPRP